MTSGLKKESLLNRMTPAKIFDKSLVMIREEMPSTIIASFYTLANDVRIFRTSEIEWMYETFTGCDVRQGVKANDLGLTLS